MIDTSKWEIDSMWDAVLDKENLGMKYHKEMFEIFSLIDMFGYEMWQQYRLQEESRDYVHMLQKYIHKFKKIYDAEEPKESLLKNVYTTKNNYNADNKRSIIDDVFSAWIEWETGVCELYMACVQWSLDNQCPDYLVFKDRLESVEKEKREIMKHYSKLQDVKYDISDILEWQEYIYMKYRDKMK